MGVYVVVFFLIIPIVAPFIGLKKLIKNVRQKDDPKLFFNKIDKYIYNINRKKVKYYFMLTKLIGVIRFENWDELDATVNYIEFNYIDSSWADTYYNTVLNLFVLEKVDAGKRLAQKLIESPKLDKNNVCVMMIFAIYEFYNGNLIESNKKFDDLLLLAKTDYQQAVIYYYLGMIEQQKQNIEQSKAYYEKSKTLGENTYLERAFQEALNSINKNE